MDNTKGFAIGACLDISWAEKAGVAPLELIDTYHDRIFEVHIRNNRKGEFTQSIDEGEIPYPELCQRLQEYGYNGWLIIELSYIGGMDLTRSFKENIVRSLWYLKGLTAAL